MGQQEKTLAHIFSAFCDFLINLGSILLAFIIIKQFSSVLDSVGGTAVTISTVVAILTVLVYFVFDLYSSKVFIRLHTQIIKITIAQILILTIAFVTCVIAFPRGDYHFVVLISTAISYLIIVLKKTITIKFVHYLRITKKRVKKVIIVGSSPAGYEYERQINENRHYGYSVIGYVAGNKKEIKNKLGTFSQLDSIIKAERPHEVVIALDSREMHNLQHIIEICDRNGTRALIIPALYRYFKSKCQVDMIGNMPIINTRAIPLDSAVNSAMKRLLDIVVSLIMIILTAPLMIFAFIGVKLSSKGPAIFKQKRVGKNNEEFTMYKFRSMRVNEMSDTAWTTNEDKRKTRFGTFLRKTGIDELPQLFNVLFGSMSIVGPRPELPRFVEEYSKSIPLYKVKHQVKPGITGLAQIYGYRGDTSIERRIELDIKYIENWTIYSDLKIIAITPFKMFNRNEKYVK